MPIEHGTTCYGCEYTRCFQLNNESSRKIRSLFGTLQYNESIRLCPGLSEDGYESVLHLYLGLIMMQVTRGANFATKNGL